VKSERAMLCGSRTLEASLSAWTAQMPLNANAAACRQNSLFIIFLRRLI
jgi:hypothetical protein